MADVEVSKLGDRAGEGGSDEEAGKGEAGVIGGAVDAGEIEDKMLLVGLRRWTRGDERPSLLGTLSKDELGESLVPSGEGGNETGWPPMIAIFAS